MFSVGKRKRNMFFGLGVLSVLSILLVTAGSAQPFPETIPLPNGFQPEGIALGEGTTFYVGSIPTGAIFRGDLETGEGGVFIDSQEGRMAIGLEYDERTGYLFAAGGPTGMAFVYDTATGDDVAAIQLTGEPNVFINDNAVTEDAVYFTESSDAVFYRVAFEDDGTLPETPEVEEVPLSGDFEAVPDAFNTNGIVAAPDGEFLIIVNSAQGALYRVDPHTGEAVLIDLGGGSVLNGDGMLLDGSTLYVVQNMLNQIAVVELDEEMTSGEIVRTLTSPAFRIPTTIARHNDALYAVNARFGTEPTPETEYEVVRVSLEE